MGPPESEMNFSEASNISSRAYMSLSSFLFNDSILGFQRGAFVVCFPVTAILKSRWPGREGRSQTSQLKWVASPLLRPTTPPSPFLQPTRPPSLRSQGHTNESLKGSAKLNVQRAWNHSGNSLASIQKQELARDNRFILKEEEKKVIFWVFCIIC